METEIPQSSGPMEDIADEAVHKERGNNLVRAATTASILEADQDSGNIDKTQSKATLNELSSPGTSSGGGPRCQETMGDTIAQTRFKNVSKLSNDLLLARGNTLRSGKDSLKLNELMEICTILQQSVLDLETTKTTQANEIASLKRRVKKLEQKKRSRTHKLKRLRKVGATARVESSDDEESLGEDASKQGRIDAIDADDDITLVSVHDVNVSAGEEEVVEVINTAKLNINAAQVSATGDKVSTAGAVTIVSITTTTTVTTVEEITLAQALADKEEEEERLAREKAQKIKEVNIAWDDVQAKVEADYQLAQRLKSQEQEELIDEEKARLFVQFLEQRRKYFAAKRAEEKRNRPPTRAQQRNIISMKMVNTFIDYKTELVEESSKKIKIELEENLKKAEAEVMEDEEEVAIDVVPLATKPPAIADWKIHKEGKNNYYQIIRADGSSKMYRVFSQMLKSFNRQDLEDLYKLVKAKYGSTRPVEYLDLILYGDLKIMFEPHVEDQVWKNQDDYKVLDWKLYDSCGVHSLRMQHVYIHMLVEKKYPLKPSTITDMLNKKLQVDYLNEMAYQLLKLLTK
ncbi:hypothetical protein Tco_0386333 [Tanacetum coccineum]